MIYSWANNLQFFSLLLAWFMAGAFSSIAAIVLVPISLVLLKFQNRDKEILFGFIFVLILSDNLYPATEFAKSLKNIYILMIAVFSFLDWNKNDIGQRFHNRFIPFFIVIICCLYFSPVFTVSFQKTLSYILLFIFIPTYFIGVLRDDRIAVLRDLIFFLLLIVIISFVLSLVNNSISFSHGNRFRGIFGNPNGMGVFIVLFYLLFRLVDSRSESMFNRGEYQIIAGVIFVAAFLTMSRNALLSVVMFPLILRVFNISIFLGFLIFISSILLFEYIFGIILDAISIAGLQEELRVDSIQEGSGRLIAWQFAWQNIQNSFFLGKGFAYDENLMRANFAYLSKLGHEGGVHNTYLIIWLNTGLIGLLAFFRGFFLVFIQGSKNSKLAFPIMITVMLSIMFEPWLAASLNPFTILFLLIATILILPDEFFNRNDEETEIKNV